MAKNDVQTNTITAQDKIARLLGILAIRGIEQKPEQIMLLRSVGFEAAEVAALVGVTPNYLDVLSYRERKKKPAKQAVKRSKR